MPRYISPVEAALPGCDVAPRAPTVEATLMAETVPHVVWIASADGSTVYFNEHGAEFTGRSRESNRDWNWLEAIHPEDAARARKDWEDAVREETEFASDYRIRRADGAYVWHALRARPVQRTNGGIQSWIGTATDIHSQKQLELSLRRSERHALETVALLQSIESATPVGFKLVDRDLRVVRINDRLAQISGLSVAESIGQSARDLTPDLWPQLEDAYRRALAGETVCGLEVTKAAADDPERLRHWLASYYPVRVDGEVVGVGNVVQDITDIKEAQEFRRIVTDNMAEGLFTLDANGLVTYVNPAALEMLGWPDEQSLRGRSKHEAIHYQHADGTTHAPSDCPIRHVVMTGRPVRVTDDAFIRSDGTVLPVAYSAAPLGKGEATSGVVVVFRDISEQKKEQANIQRELETLSWVGRIRDAIDEDRIVVYSQPIVSLGDGAPAEELLVRMVGRNGELILPDAFLGVAERYGLITEIDRFVITQAVRLAARTNRTIEANVSATSIEASNLVAFIERQIRKEGADPANLVFEITETALMKDVRVGTEFARGLREIGCGLALDDFGTGYGSFTYLKNLPLTYIKIDIEFVRDLAVNAGNRHVVAAIVSLAKAFGLKTIAEGVEDEETLDLLRTLGVDSAQGYHLGVPAPISDH